MLQFKPNFIDNEIKGMIFLTVMNYVTNLTNILPVW